MADHETLELTLKKPGEQGAGLVGHGALPGRIGRYRIEGVLGKGGFGLVYLASDDQLGRRVAVKVPHAHLLSGSEDAELYLAEARTVANLDHPHIVPVHDVGGTPEFPCYMVSKYVEGSNLATRLKQSRLGYAQSAELIAIIAEALHYAHKQGLVHRDVKPGNILIGSDGRPYLVDFGLALREQDVGHGPRYAGTPAYMSPEQARSEGHRVDGRSDIFSLGVVLYEMLVGRHPFAAQTERELLEQIKSTEARPPRQIDDAIPKELERICLKALSKRAADRYTTAKDLADDLREFLAALSVSPPSGSARGIGSRSSTPVTPSSSTGLPSAAPASSQAGVASATTATSGGQLLKIVPKGLRSFGAHDADFFLELLPGPRDREGLPDSLRFWKTQIEETDSDKTFSVGLICGPSGCGKSSLLKAGLLPLLSPEVLAVYVEATADQTESRLLSGIRKACPGLTDSAAGWLSGPTREVSSESEVRPTSPASPLAATLAALRWGQGLPPGKKVLLVLDQFEQWLHASSHPPLSPGSQSPNPLSGPELVSALRQCDGGRVQCLVLVRDDFWMAVIRFMRELEVRLMEGHNSAAVDLFDLDHARRVLAAFGRAFGKLPENARETTAEQKEFLKQSVAGLAQEGKVVCVRLALFAEMMKGKTWTPATLQEVGGTQGVGATFLEGTFSASSAPPEHRYHQHAARAVLKALLPESDANIKGQMRSYEELLEASGYARRPQDFDDLIRILDSEIRLLTPTDPEGKESGEREDVSPPSSVDRYYQLTHDYLVPSLRDWLTRKQKETRRGRAELLLADRAAVWNARPEHRQLPSLTQWLQIQWLTKKKDWTPPQRRMMAKAGRYQAARGAVVAALLAIAAFTGLTIRERVVARQQATYAQGLVGSLLTADIMQVPAVVSDLDNYRKWADPLLTVKLAAAREGSTEKLHLALALLPVDDRQLEYLSTQLPLCSREQLPVLRTALLPYQGRLVQGLWRLVQDGSGDADQRFQAAAALAEYAPEDERWKELAPFVAQHMTSSVAIVDLGQWLKLFQPARRQLAGSLTVLHAARGRSEKQREAAALALADYLRDKPEALADVILEADEFAEFSPLIAALLPQAAAVRQRLLTEMRAAMPESLAKKNDQLSDEDQQRRDAHWKRQSLAAVTLVHLGYGNDIWPLLAFTPDPSLRSFIIYHLGKLRTDYNTLAARLEVEPEVSIRRALIQSLGGLDASRLSPADQRRISEHLVALYAHDPDPGIHGSASWTLRQWGVTLPKMPIGEPALNDERRWYVNSQGQTMVIFPKPVNDAKHPIDHGLAVSTHEVTLAEFRRFLPQHRVVPKVANSPDCPVHNISWYLAAEYCNWLNEQERISRDQWFYEPNDGGKYAEGMRIRANYTELCGYRLPNEAEWVFACRGGAAGVAGTYVLGEPVSLLKRYARFVLNSYGRSHPVESLLPNEAGLFDMHGNLFEWTEQPPSGGSLAVTNNMSRVQLSGCIENRAVSQIQVQARETYRIRLSGGGPGQGFRVVRTHFQAISKEASRSDSR